MDITPKKLLIEQIHGHSLKKFTAFITKKNVAGCFWLLHRLFNIFLRILINFIFDFQAMLLFAKIAQSDLHHLSTSFVLKLLYVLSTSFLAYSSFVKVVQLFKSFPMIYSMTIFRKKSFQPYEA